jgi:acetyltransferase-like isoleucine patch superfamily enzyme
MRLYKNYLFLDIVAKAKERMFQFILFPYWKIKLGKIGKHSKVKSGVIIIGNGRRIKIGDNFTVFHRCFLTVCRGTIKFGSNGHLGVDCYLNATEGNICIGDNVLIAPKTQIYSYSSCFKIDSKIDADEKVGDVIIKNNVRVGSGVIILPGVTINEGAIIGAGAVVNKDVAQNIIVGGIPAKELIKK